MNNKEYEAYLKKFGSNLRSIRKAKGLSMETIANESEMDYRQYGRIERGEINTTIISLLRISKVLKIELYELFNLDMD